MEKLQVKQWQWDEIGDIVYRDVEDVEKWLAERFELKRSPVRNPDLPNAYIVFGYRKDADQWLRDHVNIPSDWDYLFIAADWADLQGLRARPVPIYDTEWYKINRTHEIVRRAREVMNELESKFGSGDPLPAHVRTYEEVAKELNEMERAFFEARTKFWNELDDLNRREYPLTMRDPFNKEST